MVFMSIQRKVSRRTDPSNPFRSAPVEQLEIAQKNKCINLYLSEGEVNGGTGVMGSSFLDRLGNGTGAAEVCLET